ncbi:hypothetical protein jhhlp_006664 [Lomentospora prolificans]|uniref:DUF6536 domain-containing protein n=1 Tax=Lomentospora prolificans TaxID=41688 RepID=A0A2N3N6P9_9PEZI|nr:hypothetical protein jhhlp_006664 [Lomentospora prolificans]
MDRLRSSNATRGVFAGAVASIIVLIINIVSLVIATRRGAGFPANPGRRVLFEGSCTTSSRLSTFLHLLINIFGSVLLASSNYAMQYLSAPTREEVNAAHQKRQSLDIGVHSISNLRRISWKRADSFFAGSVDNLTNADCIAAYAKAFQLSRASVALISDPDPARPDVQVFDLPAAPRTDINWAGCALNAYDWICTKHPGFEIQENVCSAPCRTVVPEILEDPASWSPFGHRVNYCLSQPAREQCRLNLNIPLASAVIATNAIKTTILLLVVFVFSSSPLLTVGDAIQSFLAAPDRSVAGLCLLSFKDISLIRKSIPTSQPMVWKNSKKRLYRAASRSRWILTLALYILSSSISIIFLIVGLKALAGPKDMASLWDLGIGAATELTIIRSLQVPTTGSSGLASNVVIANIPQLGLSMVYFSFNGILTAMLAGKEWSRFGSARRHLRVSAKPKGAQKSRYMLQLPYRYGLPLLVFSALLHWLVSQSIFILAVETSAESRGEAAIPEGEFDILSCGYSPIAIILVLLISACFVLGIILVGMTKFASGMPVVGSRSLGMAAACQVQHSFSNLCRGLQWGVLAPSSSWETEQEIVGTCGFSACPVEAPIKGRFYA